MARIPTEGSAGHSDSSFEPQNITLNASEGHSLTLPGHAYVTDAQMLRDGQDLVLHPAHGPDVIVQNYFAANPAPVLTTGDGPALTPDLVDSFVKPVGGVQFAENNTASDASPVGAIKETSGEATVTHANGTVEKAAIGTPIFEGDIIETKDHGAVNITFVDNTTFAVSENAKMAIDQYVFDPSSQHGENNFSVLRGVFVYTSGLIGHADPDDVKINTPVGSIGIRGTTIMGTINPDGNSHVTVVEGAIVVSNAAGEKTLSQQFETVGLTGMNQAMNSEGVLSAEAIATSYNVLRTVSAPLFSTFDDLGKKAAEQPADAQPPTDSGTEAPKTEAKPADAPAQQQTAPQDQAPQQAPAPAPATDIAPDRASMDAGFDTSAGLASTSTFSSDAPVSTTTSTAPVSATFASAQVVAAPPPVNTTASTTTTSTAAGSTTITPPPVTTTTTTAPPPAQDLILNNIIASNSGGRFIPSTAAGSMHGSALAALGDYNHDGRDDYAFVNNLANTSSLFIDDTLGNHFNIDLSAAPFNLSDTTKLSIASAGDVNRDGKADIIIGAYNSDTGGTIGAGQVFIASGASPNSTAIQVTGFQDGQMAGLSVAGIGDYNGDGFNDVIIGAPENSGIGHAYVLFGRTTMAPYDVTNLGSSGFVINGPTSFRLGQDVAGIGDFNDDGFSDFAVSVPGGRYISIHFGNASGTDTTPLNITGLAPGVSPDIVSLGDVNGGGISDIGVYDDVAGKFYIFYGSAARAAGSIAASTADVILTAPAGSKVIAGASAGDFNGDGLDDAMVALRNGSSVDVYVVYGKAGLAGTIDASSIGDNNMFHMSLDLTSSQFNLTNPASDAIKITLSSAGDLNGDGFNDILIGLPNIDSNGGTHSDDGGLIIVNGRAEASDISAGKLIIGNTATADNQALVGSTATDVMTNFKAGGQYNNVSFNSGAGDDIINFYGSSNAMIDGGTGKDTVNIYASGLLDLTNVSGNDVKNIETIQMQSDGTTIKLGLNDIFSLMQQSEDGILRITDQTNGGAGTGTTALQIEDNGTGFAMPGSSGTITVGGETYNNYAFGNYHLYIDVNVNSVTVV